MTPTAAAVLRAAILVAVLGFTANARTETLEEAWQQAVRHDQALAARTSEVAAARAAERAATAQRWPTLQGHAGYTKLATAPAFDISGPGFSFRSSPIVDNDDFVTAGVQLTLPIYTGGRVSADIDAARQALTSAEADESSTTAAVKLEVARAYVDVLRARRALKAADSSVESLTAHSSDVRAMVERELVPTSDLLAARVALANAVQAHVRASNAAQVANAAYNRRLGQPLDRVPDLAEDIPLDPALAAMPPVEALIERAVKARPELHGMTARAEALEQQSRAERAAQLPQLALTGGYSYLDNEFLDRDDFSMIGIGVQWRLFDGGQTRQRASALHSASRATRQRLEDQRSLIELEVREAWLNVHAARSRVAASREAVAQADENLRMTRELYGADLGTNTQVLDAVTLQVSATSNRDNAALDESLALLQLAYAVGEL